MRIYIAGPIGKDQAEAFKRFRTAEAYLRKKGHAPLNPMDGPAGTKERSEYMRRGFLMLLTCDAIFMLDGWESSPGAACEHDVAHECKMTLLYESCRGRCEV